MAGEAPNKFAAKLPFMVKGADWAATPWLTLFITILPVGLM
jgi:hypothetical protein